MKYIREFFKFWYDFIVGDDWTVAAAVAAALVVVYWLAHLGLQVWWLMPAVVILATGLSVWRARAASTRARSLAYSRAVSPSRTAGPTR